MSATQVDDAAAVDVGDASAVDAAPASEVAKEPTTPDQPKSLSSSPDSAATRMAAKRLERAGSRPNAESPPIFSARTMSKTQEMLRATGENTGDRPIFTPRNEETIALLSMRKPVSSTPGPLSNRTAAIQASPAEPPVSNRNAFAAAKQLPTSKLATVPTDGEPIFTARTLARNAASTATPSPAKLAPTVEEADESESAAAAGATAPARVIQAVAEPAAEEGDGDGDLDSLEAPMWLSLAATAPVTVTDMSAFSANYSHEEEGRGTSTPVQDEEEAPAPKTTPRAAASPRGSPAPKTTPKASPPKASGNTSKRGPATPKGPSPPKAKASGGKKAGAKKGKAAGAKDGIRLQIEVVKVSSSGSVVANMEAVTISLTPKELGVPLEQLLMPALLPNHSLQTLAKAVLQVNGDDADGRALASSFTSSIIDGSLTVVVSLDDSVEGAASPGSTPTLKLREGDAWVAVNFSEFVSGAHVASSGAMLGGAWLRKSLLKGVVEPALQQTGICDHEPKRVIHSILVKGQPTDGSPKLSQFLDSSATGSGGGGGVEVQVRLKPGTEPAFFDVEILSHGEAEVLGAATTTLSMKQLEKSLANALIKPALSYVDTGDAALSLERPGGPRVCFESPDGRRDWLDAQRLMQERAALIVPRGGGAAKPTRVLIVLAGDERAGALATEDGDESEGDTSQPVPETLELEVNIFGAPTAEARFSLFEGRAAAAELASPLFSFASKYTKRLLLKPIMDGLVGPALGAAKISAVELNGHGVSVVVAGKAVKDAGRTTAACLGAYDPALPVTVAIYLPSASGFDAASALAVSEASLEAGHGSIDIASALKRQVSRLASGLRRLSGGSSVSSGGSPEPGPPHGALFHVTLEARRPKGGNDFGETPSPTGWVRTLETRVASKWAHKTLDDAIVWPAMEQYYASMGKALAEKHALAALDVTVNSFPLTEEAVMNMPASFFVYSDDKPVDVSIVFDALH